MDDLYQEPLAALKARIEKEGSKAVFAPLIEKYILKNPHRVMIEMQEKDPGIKCFLADPPVHCLFNKVTSGVMYTKEEAERKRLKYPFDTITEGIGINRLTKNFKIAQLGGAFKGTVLKLLKCLDSC